MTTTATTPAPAPAFDEDARNPAVWPTILEAPSVTLVIPAVNEARSIGWVLERVPDFVTEVILVDGQSTDGTVEVARRACPGIVVLNEPRRGKGAALRAGFQAATGEVIVMIDADGSMDPREITRYVSLLQAADYDLVKGSRFAAGGGSTDITRFRSIGNRCLLGLVNFFYKSRFSELCYGFMAFRRCRLAQLDLTADGFEIETEIVVNSLLANLKIGEVASLEQPRRHGQSNLRPVSDGSRVLRTILQPIMASQRVPSVEVGLATSQYR